MIWLLGAGPMAVEYAKVLEAQGRHFTCITRSATSAEDFRHKTSFKAVSGGIEAFLSKHPKCAEHAIIATGVEQLADCTDLLLEYGVTSILVEKPAGLYLGQVQQTQRLVERYEAQVFVAYNRRFYASVMAAQKMILDDGGVTSLTYEITEWSHIIDKLNIDESVKRNWFIANTSHVVDLAFYLGGVPKELASFTSGSTNWHSRSANFTGAGITEKGALFSYSGNWNAPGRWGIEVSTTEHRFILCPLEQLQLQKIGEIGFELIPIDNELDVNFKPGIYLQLLAFLEGEGDSLCTINEHLVNLSHYRTMANYDI